MPSPKKEILKHNKNAPATIRSKEQAMQREYGTKCMFDHCSKMFVGSIVVLACINCIEKQMHQIKLWQMQLNRVFVC